MELRWINGQVGIIVSLSELSWMGMTISTGQLTPQDGAANSGDTVATQSMPMPGTDTGFRWGPKSLKELTGVRKELVDCATLALTRFSTVDFTCFDGIRTLEEQKHYVAIGTSQTMQSKHLDGLAVDLVPMVGGIPKWDWNLIYEVAWAMDQAATHLGMAQHIRWGGAWDRTLADFGGDAHAYANEVQAYNQRHPGRDFIDGPHFEWKD